MKNTLFVILLSVLFSNGIFAQSTEKIQPVVITLPALPYAYNALEPYFDEQTMTIHHSKHHQAYINNLNAELAKGQIEQFDLYTYFYGISKIENAVLRNNAGGHFNHTFFWKSLQPAKGQLPQGKLLDAINRDFGSLDKFKELFAKEAMGRFGSGWAWLIYSNDKLIVTSTSNQDNPLMNDMKIQGFPLLAIDVWEHAYYLKYQNKRADYVTAFWNIVNWDEVAKRLELASTK
ncbi:MAG: hypothetical protein RLZZ175_5 [Bacteroidota bacterium]|jgi:Fe-Mn family superoxide dismutase